MKQNTPFVFLTVLLFCFARNSDAVVWYLS